MTRTHQGHYQAAVKEGPNGEPIIVFESVSGEPIRELKGDVVGIHMKPGTKVEQVQDIATAINEHMSSFFVTSFRDF
jgi:hypothetical protein